MNITLIGMSGVGKSYIGKKLAEKLNYNFIDLDEEIKKKTKLNLQYIIEKFGEKVFIEIEKNTALQLGSIQNCVISPGGSIVYSKHTMNYLKEISTVVYLVDSFQKIKNKIIKVIDNRGIIGLKKKSFKMLYEERKPLYEKYADILIKMPEYKGPEDIVENIIQKTQYRR